jgi:hypothetical protein
MNPANVGIASPEADVLSLIITRPEDTTHCPFWVGLYKKGEAGAQEVFGLERIDDVFKLLTEEGLNEEQALMLSDSSGQAVRQFYLVPEVLCRKDRMGAKALILKTVEAMKPSRIGLYFGIDAKDPDSSRLLLEEILMGLAETGIRELFLFTGDLGVNTVLNAALCVKHGLAGSLDMRVFH